MGNERSARTCRPPLDELPFGIAKMEAGVLLLGVPLLPRDATWCRSDRGFGYVVEELIAFGDLGYCGRWLDKFPR